MSPRSNLHTAWAGLFVRALAMSGVKDIVVSPGSRSTPLVIAAAREERITCHVILDERSAAFFALGQAKASGRPSALVCTSGTAGAHYFAAILEASQSFTPMVVITADRPWEAYDAAAAQTIDQVKLFGSHVRHYAELGLPDPSPSALRAVPRIAAQAVQMACGPTPGPIHVNARFRKPLEPLAIAGDEAWQATVNDLAGRRPPSALAPRPVLDAAVLSDLVQACQGVTRGLVVCGPAAASLAHGAARAAIAAFASTTGFPILPEAASQMRFGIANRGASVCAAFDAVLRDRAFCSAHSPEVIVEIGGPPTSSAYAAFLEQSTATRRFVLAPHGWNDPRGDATALFSCDPYALARAAAERLTRVRGDETFAWCNDFVQADAAISRLVFRELGLDVLTEGRVVHDLVSALPEDALLVVSNSNVVRDLDLYTTASSCALRVLHQRGASGIDGLVSSAAGARTVSRGTIALLLGDLAFAHDVGGLAAARAVGGPLPIVVVQNHGGRIFEQLPVWPGGGLGADCSTGGGVHPGVVDPPADKRSHAVTDAEFERFFATPQALDLAHAAAAFGLAHRRVETPGDFARALREALVMDAPVVIEAMVAPHDATARRAKIWSGP